MPRIISLTSDRLKLLAAALTTQGGAHMAAYCLDCSHKMTGAIDGGHRPACGSFNLRVPGKKEKIAKPVCFPRLRLALLVGLWLYLFFLIYRQLSI
jgi:hypothetical protein